MGETPVEWRRNSIAHPSDSRVLSRVTHLLKLCMKDFWCIRFTIGCWGLMMAVLVVLPAVAMPIANPVFRLSENPDENIPSTERLDLSPEIIEGSPVLQRWIEEIPDVWEEISGDPSFPTRVRFGYIRLADDQGVWSVGIEDAFVDRSGFTLGGVYEQTGDGDRSLGADLRYYLLPLGSSVNLAPVVGYRYIEQEGDIHKGVNVGVRVLVVLSRGGGSELSIKQMWVAPLSNETVSLTTFSVVYALTRDLRVSTDLQQQNGEGRIGVFLEWIP